MVKISKKKYKNTKSKNRENEKNDCYISLYIGMKANFSTSNAIFLELFFEYDSFKF